MLDSKALSRLIVLVLCLVSVPSALAGADAEAIAADVEAALARADVAANAIVAIPDDARSYENTVAAIDDMIAQLELDTNMIQYLAYVSTDPVERAAGNAAEERITNWRIELDKNEDLYRAVTAGTEPA